MSTNLLRAKLTNFKKDYMQIYQSDSAKCFWFNKNIANLLTIRNGASFPPKSATKREKRPRTPFHPILYSSRPPAPRCEKAMAPAKKQPIAAP